MTVLEKHYDSNPSDIPELRRRSKVIECATVLPVVLGAEFVPESCRKSRSNVGCCTRDQGRRNILINSKMTRIYSNFSKIHERQCMITRSVRDFGPLIYIDKNNRWNGKLRSISKSVN